jgi:hypothetical protein
VLPHQPSHQHTILPHPHHLPLYQAQLLPLGRKPPSKPAPTDPTHLTARAAGGLPQLLQLGGAKVTAATAAAGGGGEELGGASPGVAPLSPALSGVDTEEGAAKSGMAGGCMGEWAVGSAAGGEAGGGGLAGATKGRFGVW